MGLLNGMKDKLGFGNKPEWQDDGYADDGYAEGGYVDDGYVDDGYADDGYADDGYAGNGYAGTGRVVSFDAYNPENFENVTLSSDREPRVASYDDLDSPAGGYSSRSSSYSARIGTSSGRRSDSYRSSRSSSADAGAASWSTPEDPSFLDSKSPAYSRDIHDDYSSSRSSDLHSSLGSDFIRMHRDPATHLEIIRPTAYSDVEKIANAAKAGKSIVLVVSNTKPETAKRILDFTFGAASALNLGVEKAADRIFVIFKGSEMLTEEERAYLKKKGVLK